MATQLYGEAARGTFEDASMAALIIVGIGIIPSFYSRELLKAFDKGR